MTNKEINSEMFMEPESFDLNAFQRRKTLEDFKGEVANDYGHENFQKLKKSEKIYVVMHLLGVAVGRYEAYLIEISEARAKPLREALENLVLLRNYKLKNGKDSNYEDQKLLRWHDAEIALESDKKFIQKT